MPQFFLAPGALRGQEFKLTGPEAFHVSKVLRFREGQAVDLFDGKGGRYQGKIVRVTTEGLVEGVIVSTLREPQAAAKVELNLYQGLMKASRWEWILEKGTEIGVTRFIPVTTARTVVLLREESRVATKADRWRKIVLAAAKQCGRGDLPQVNVPLSFRDALKETEGHGLTLLAWEKMVGSFAGDVLEPLLQKFREEFKNPQKLLTVNLFIGPEGGFSEEEVELAKFHGAELFALGSSTLRGETAAIAASVLVLYELGKSPNHKPA